MKENDAYRPNPRKVVPILKEMQAQRPMDVRYWALQDAITLIESQYEEERTDDRSSE